MSESDKWCSPPEVTDPVAEFFDGPVDIDPCSNERSLVLARTTYTSGGLVLPWVGTAYENPPYSQGGPWVAKGLAEMKNGNVRELIRLTMFQSSTQWWSDMCLKPRRNPRILGLTRLKFLDPRQSDPMKDRQVCRFEPALTYFGPRQKRFDRVFAHLTMWSTWGRS